MGGWRELLHTNALRKVFRVKFSKAPERFKSQNPIFQSHLNEQEKISKENTPASRGRGLAAVATGTAPRGGGSQGAGSGSSTIGHCSLHPGDKKMPWSPKASLVFVLPQQPWGCCGHCWHQQLRAQTPGAGGVPGGNGKRQSCSWEPRSSFPHPTTATAPQSISGSPFSILMNRKGSWDPLRQRPQRLDPPKE